jgi:hypothetical protein
MIDSGTRQVGVIKSLKSNWLTLVF